MVPPDHADLPGNEPADTLAKTGAGLWVPCPAIANARNTTYTSWRRTSLTTLCLVRFHRSHQSNWPSPVLFAVNFLAFAAMVTAAFYSPIWRWYFSACGHFLHDLNSFLSVLHPSLIFAPFLALLPYLPFGPGHGMWLLVGFTWSFSTPLSPGRSRVASTKIHNDILIVNCENRSWLC